ncbi:MAG: hypothetical protein GY740_09600 [Gammaproteobacteria bacterium]|nr:hypothetical protein [Gammaproteobacteria bacterium]
MNDPKQYLSYLKSHASLISDGTVESNCTYGRWKAERTGATACVFVGPKMYAYEFAKGDVQVKLKGVSKRMHRDLRFADFVRMLNPTEHMTCVNVGFNVHDSLMATTRQKKTISGLYCKS